VNTIFGLAVDPLGISAKNELVQGERGPELRRRAWATPAAEFRRTQPAEIPVDRGHDGRPVGRVVHLERTNAGIWAVAEVEDFISEPWDVVVGAEHVYWSPSVTFEPGGTDVELRSLALTAFPASVAARTRPLAIFPGPLRRRGSWSGLNHFTRALLERASETNYRKRWNEPTVVHDDEADAVEYVGAGNWRNRGELYSERRERESTFTDPGGRPLRWRRGRILAVR
jgi:hypothetical protein